MLEVRKKPTHPTPPLPSYTWRSKSGEDGDGGVLGLSELPVEVLMHVISYLAPRELSYLGQTASHLQHLCALDEFWQPMFFSIEKLTPWLFCLPDM